MVLFEVINGILLAVLLVFGIALICIIINFTKNQQKFENKKDRFQWHFDKLLLSYKIHILKTDIKAEGITIEQLDEIAENALEEKKASRQHVLDEVKEEVRGELENAKGEVKKTSSK